ncbi:MAG: NUDIX hydrolase [Lachnospiraceae bacterium]|nr:NUDIX hydrolase [Lachnospiraceae bacterium]
MEEKEFLKNYNMKDYERPSVTTDVVVFKVRSTKSDNYRQNSGNNLSMLLIKRGGHPYKDCWALPGGFFQSGETVEECAKREIFEETKVLPVAIMPVGIFSTPLRDPRGWIISCAYASILASDVNQEAGDDASDAQWFDITFDEDDKGNFIMELVHEDVTLKAVLRETKTEFGRTSFDIKESGGLAFDHASIIATALSVLKYNANDYETIMNFLPEKFTLTQMQNIQETILNISILPANFRRKVADYVVETDEFTQGAGHRPAKLYKRKKG